MDKSSMIYGSMDGLITTMAIVAGTLAAGLPINVIIVLGFANLFADGFSMAVSRYTSGKDHLKNPLRQSILTFLAFVIVGFLPVLCFMIFGQKGFMPAFIVTGIAFFMIGFSRNRLVNDGLQSLLIGSIATAMAYGIGAIAAKKTGT